MPKPQTMGAVTDEIYRFVHKTIAAVTVDLEKFHFNKAVARIREMSNELDRLEGSDPGASWVLRDGLETLARLVGPMMPHLAEEMWRRLGHETLLAGTGWPEFEDSLLVDEKVTVAVQVNGKLRGTIDVAKDCANEEVEKAALAVENVIAAMGGKDPRKVIVVPNRIVNVVV